MQWYSTSQLAIITAVPTVTVLLIWTIAIYYKNRKHWQPYDIAIVAILFQSVLKNITTLTYTILTILHTRGLSNEYCTAAIWLFNSIHTFQASTLCTLSVVALYLINLQRKRKDIKQYLTSGHIAYHLFCLTTLCACVGVAAILARHEWTDGKRKSANFEFNYSKNLTAVKEIELEVCQFMPYQLDIKYNFFILTLHALLAFISALCFISAVFKYYQFKRHGFDYLKKSTSDLSDLSLGAAASTVSPKDDMSKNYFDSYQKPEYEQNRQETQGYGNVKNDNLNHWNSDTSNISTSVSSTNSRRPCLKRTKQENGGGLETILPVLSVCYLLNHLPVFVICLCPWLVRPWSAPGAALWLSLLQDALLPAAMALVDGRFGGWVSRVYRCGGRRKTQADKLPHGLDGKFRPFSSTPQSMEVAAPMIQARTRPLVPQQDHKFPITNGSLYTSIDGHLPIIHNYRRHKGLRSPVHSISMGLHSTYIKRQESILNQQIQVPIQFQTAEPCDESFISLPADYTSIGSNFIDTVLPTAKSQPPKPPRNMSQSQNSLSDVNLIENELRKMRQISKSQDNINSSMNVLQRDIQSFRKNPEVYQRQNLSKTQLDKEESSDEEYFNNEINYSEEMKSFDTMSSESYCSITTEANCDFEFFGKHVEDPSLNYILHLSPKGSVKNTETPILRSFKPFDVKNVVRKNSRSPKSNRHLSERDLNRNFRITRSNSKRSLDKLDSYIQGNDVKNVLERSNSNGPYDLLSRTGSTYIVGSNSNTLSNKDVMNSYPNINDIRKPSVSYLNLKNLNSSCIHFEDLKNSEHLKQNASDKQKKTVPVLSVENLCSILNHRGISYLDNGDICKHNYSGSVPDLKKIFVSDYI